MGKLKQKEIILEGGQKMNPFQVNCSELIADFGIHDDKEVRNILNFLVSEYDIDIYFEIEVLGQEEFFFNENRCFNVLVDDITFNVSISSFKHYEIWVVKCNDKGNLGRIIESIGKYQIQRYGEMEYIASSLFARSLINEILTFTPCYSQSKDFINTINFDEIFDFSIKIGNNNYFTTLRYGSNGYDDTLGWYFKADHCDGRSYPFYEWAERSYNAKIKAFDGGKVDRYLNYKENPEKEGLKKKL